MATLIESVRSVSLHVRSVTEVCKATAMLAAMDDSSLQMNVSKPAQPTLLVTLIIMFALLATLPV